MKNNWTVSLITGITYVTFAAVMATGAMLMWMLFLDPVTPLESTRLVGIHVENPPDRNGHFVVTREFCFSEPSVADVYRLFRRVTEDSDRRETIEVPPIRVNLEGPPCYVRPRKIELPAGITPGLWEYIPIMEWQNAIGRSVTKRNSTIVFDVRQEGGRLVVVDAREVQ